MKIEVEKFLITLPTNEAFMLYFMLESNEGLCFYSTVEKGSQNNNEGLTQIEATFHPSTKETLIRLLLSIKHNLGLNMSMSFPNS